MGWWPYGFGMMGGWGWLGMLIPIIVLALLVYWLVRTFSHSSSSEGRDRALDILRERYARGELDQESFERMKRDLEE
ncbi:MAG: SHOCT domain-containing protein [Thermaceae bacterium]|nr:SHOCT domain-containing protein [Thermaceae bacterium]